jgi:hypothetical protein
MRTPAQCGIPFAQMSKGVTASFGGFAPKTTSRGSACYADSASSRGTIDTDEKELADGASKDGEGERTRVAARKKEKALGPCELRALLRDEPSSPCTRHGRRRITGHRRTLRSDDASYARALDRAHNLTSLARRDRNRFRSLQGRVTTATPVPGNWTSCMAG